MRQKRNISVLNFKGGVSKTTTSLSLGDELNRRGYKIIIVDCERQCNVTSFIPEGIQVSATLKEVLMGEAEVKDALYEIRPGFFILPSHTDLEIAAKYLVVNSSPKIQKRLKYGLATQDVDFILFDHSPSLNSITEVALMASEEVLIPVFLEPFAIEGLLDMIEKLGGVLDLLEHEVQTTGIIPSAIDHTLSMTHIYLESLKEEFKELVLSPVRTDAQVKKAQSVHKFIRDYNPRAKAVADFKTITDQILGVASERELERIAR